MDKPTKSEEPQAPGAPGNQYQVPEWELPSKPRSRRSIITNIPAFSSTKSSFTGISDRVKRKMRVVLWPLPWAGADRKVCIWIGICSVIIIVAVGVGVGVGLKRGHGLKYALSNALGDWSLTFCRDQNLPLPNNSEKHTGDLTYYGVGLGACGISSADNQNVVAVAHSLFDAASTGSDPNANPLCGQKIRATRFYAEVGSERSVDLTVVDRCVGCQPTDLDVSTGAFDQMAPESSGRVDVTWAWLSPQATGS